MVFTETFTHKSFYTEKSLHRGAFTRSNKLKLAAVLREKTLAGAFGNSLAPQKSRLFPTKFLFHELFSKNIRNIFLKQVPIQKLSSPHCDEMECREIRRSRRGASASNNLIITYHKLIRAPAPRPCPCRRPSVVTEGYIRLPPLPPTTSCRFRFTVARFRFTIIVAIYSVFCVWCSKNIVFYRVLWPSPSPGFILATLKNHGFFKVLGLRQGSGTDNWTS